MNKQNIAIAEPSEIINDGLTEKIKNSGMFRNLYSYFTYETLANSLYDCYTLIINPILIINREKEFEKFCKNRKVLYSPLLSGIFK